jgi:hypothetical protein
VPHAARTRITTHGTRPTRRQVERVRAVVRWYLETYHGSADDLGTAAMFCSRARMGEFAVTPEALAHGTPAALFRVLIASALFQRLQDVLVFRILRGLTRPQAQELTTSRRLLRLADASPCPVAHTRDDLEQRCDLAKDPTTRLGVCAAHPSIECHLKRHTVALKRYGDFGKMPSSAALMLREAQVPDLRALRATIYQRTSCPSERAALLFEQLRTVWRVDRKIASMFLSAVANPDLSPGSAPWVEGIDWRRFIVVDSNVDRYLAAVRYDGGPAYSAREAFVSRLAEEIDLSHERPGIHAYNPRLVQQALYMFMSTTNRRASRLDCSRRNGCARCPADVAKLCALRPA